MTTLFISRNSSPKAQGVASSDAISSKINFMSKFYVDVCPIITMMKDSEASKVICENYKPSKYDVICGRGKGHYNQPGNKIFRSIIMSRLQEYQALKTKIDKTMFLNKIIDDVRSQNNGKAHFVRQIGTDKWEVLGDEKARDKVGHAIREALAPRCKEKSAKIKGYQEDKGKPLFDINNKKQTYQRQEQEKYTLNLVDVDAYEPLPVTCTSISLSMSSQLLSFINQIEHPILTRSCSALSERVAI